MTNFSIIVPVYNAEKYLSDCLKSLIGQTCSDVEIICINDGSTDNSLKILQEYANKDSRIKIINQENQGVSIARNNGINIAQGEYLLFVDADDWISESMCEDLFNSIKASKSDIIYFNYYNCSDKQTRPINMICSNSTDFKDIIIPGLWCKAYKTTFIKKNNITFPTGISMAEDMIFILKTISKNPSTSYLKKYLYYYRNDNQNSATHKDNKYVNSTPYKCWFDTEEYKNLSDINKLATIDFFAKQIFGGWSTWYSNETKERNNQIIDEFLEYYEKFDYKDYKNLIGYRRLKHKEIWRFLKIIRNFAYKFIYRKRG